MESEGLVVRRLDSPSLRLPGEAEPAYGQRPLPLRLPQDASAPLVLREFGPLELEGTDGVVRQRGGKPLLILLWLLHAAPRRASREELCRLFWPDDPPENARRSLRQALVQHRRWLGAEGVCTDEDLVWIAPGLVVLESRLMRDALRDGRAETVWGCYRAAWAVDAERLGGDRLEPWVRGTRAGLARAFSAFAAGEVREAMAAAEFARACALSATATAVAPRDDALALLRAEALMAVGERTSAREALEQFMAITAAAGDPVSGPVRRLLDRLTGDAPNGAGRGGHRPGERLVARDAELAAVWRALALARGGRPQRVLVTGERGVGKTRLLDELEARLQTYALQVVRVRVTAEMRTLPGAALVACVRTIAARRGASGVSAASAAVLVHLAPELAPLFAGVSAPPVRPAADVASGAVVELLEAVAEERTTVLLVDDLHFADPWSVEVWRAVVLRAPVALLEVTTARSGGEAIRFPDATSLELAPFGAPEVRALVATVATVPDAPWVDALVAALVEATRGTPSAVLRTLRTLEVQGTLVVRGGMWTAVAEETLPAAVAAAAASGRTVTGEAATQLLRLLTAWGAAVPEDRLLDVAEACWPALGRPAWSQALETLERDGAAWRRGRAWVAEGEVVGGAGDAEDERARVLAAFGVQLFTEDLPPSAADVERLIRRAGGCGAFAVAADVVRRLARGPHLRRLGVPRSGLARHVALLAGQPAWERSLRRAMGFTGRRSRRSLLALGVATGLLVTLLGWVLGAWQPRLVVEVAPMPDCACGETVLGLAVQPRVAVRDGFGRRRAMQGVTVRVRGEGVRVVGDTVRESAAGRVQYEELLLHKDYAFLESANKPAVLHFSGPWWMRSARVELPRLRWNELHTDFRLISASVNGRPFGEGWVANVAEGEDSLTITITFEFTARLATANYVLGAAPLWLPRESSVVRVAGLPRPVIEVWSSRLFTVPAPREPGRHVLILAMDAEESVDHLFSRTNWVLGAPRWYDGNDLHDMSAAERAMLRDSSHVMVSRWQNGVYRGRLGYYVGDEDRMTPSDTVMVERRRVTGAVLEVVVGEGGEE